MMMLTRAALLATTLLTLPLIARAEPVQGVYVAGAAGVNLLARSVGDAEIPLLQALQATGVSDRSELRWDLGWAGIASLGYGFSNGLRIEAEGSFRENSLDRATVFGAVASQIGGHARSYGAMGNVLYDFNTPGWSVTPYLGLGLGYVWHEYDGLRGTFGRVRAGIDDTDGSFAYQAMAGLSMDLGIAGLALTAEYRFLGTLFPEMELLASNAVTRTPLGQGTLEVGNYNHSVLIGLRYNFGAPRPAPVPVAAPAPAAAAPAPARTYLVFFDFDRADLTDRARRIIGEAAQAVQSTGTTRIEVAGHADRSGTPQYNQRLSMRRAEAVAAELARRGIARDQMSIQAFGESRPLVPTADGVREPQNRRVEIVLR
jgi:outer membrane protein OmpA-like peptidoglycan-associated protein/opacity protein-like surface antigen